MREIKLHFVCNGNVFRSRLAAAYAESFRIPGVKITSSGVLNYVYDDQPRDYLSPWAVILARQHGFLQYLMKGVMVKTTEKMLGEQDIIVFMNTDIYETARSKHCFLQEKALVWRVKDRQEWKKSLKLTAVQRRNRSWKHIRANVDELMKDITAKCGWVDVVDADDRPLGFCWPLRLASKKGLYKRGCHVVITTPSGKVLTQKRSKSIMFAPGRIDITLGGYVDTGETPLQAIVRETKEEIGIAMPQSHFRQISVSRQWGWSPRYEMCKRNITYNYHLMLDTETPRLTLQLAEVERVDILSQVKVKSLIRRRYLKRVGRLNYPRAYYAELIRLVFG